MAAVTHFLPLVDVPEPAYITTSTLVLKICKNKKETTFTLFCVLSVKLMYTGDTVLCFVASLCPRHKKHVKHLHLIY